MQTKEASFLKEFPWMHLPGAMLLLIVSATVGLAAPLDQVLAKMDTAASAFRGLTADIVKVDHTAIINDDEVEHGSIVLIRPKPKDFRALFTFNGLNPKQVSYAGRTGKIYYPKANTVDVYDVDKKYGSLLNQYMLLGFGATSKDLREVYSLAPGGEETVSGQKTMRIELTPRKPDTGMGLTKAELWISEETGMAVQQKLNIRGGETHLFTYTNMKINPNITDSAVTLKTPKGVKVQYPQK
jgi:outer membrane lipoprotein-sorting protein